MMRHYHVDNTSSLFITEYAMLNEGVSVLVTTGLELFVMKDKTGVA